MARKLIVLIYALLSASSANAFFGAGVFPKDVKSTCSLEWFKNGLGDQTLRGSANVLIDLKNKSGELEEKAFIHIECKPKALRIAGKITTETQCAGIRINGLGDKELRGSNDLPP